MHPECKFDTLEKLLAAGPKPDTHCYAKRDYICKACARLYAIWWAARDRCHNPKSHAYARYGGRGIVMCDEWRASFDVFRLWALGNGYAPNLTIDRLENDGNYEPANCAFRTRSKNQCNKGKSRTYAGSQPTSKYKGVSRAKLGRPWQARIQANGVSYSVGKFDTQEDAARAWDAFAKRLHGDAAVLNFPNS
jgi:hypothetical protein